MIPDELDTRPDWNGMTTEQRDDHIRPLWEGGKSASEIAATMFGATRNSVIGRIHRGKMVQRKPVKPKRAKPAKTKMPADQQMPKKPVRNRNTISTKPRAETPPSEFHASKWLDEDRPPMPGTTPVSILDLPNRPGVKCRFPVQGGYCGIECGENVYCPTHHGYTHTKSAPPPINGKRK